MNYPDSNQFAQFSDILPVMIYTEEKASQKFLLLTKVEKPWIKPNTVLRQKVFKRYIMVTYIWQLFFEIGPNMNSGAPNENIVQNHLDIALLNVF